VSPSREGLRARRSLHAAVFFAVALGAAWFAQGGAMNQNSRYDLTRAIVESGTLRIDRYAANTMYDRSEHDGHLYSDKAPGLSLVAAPVYAITRHLGPSSPPERSPDTLELHLLTFFTVGLASAFGAVVLLELLLSLGLSVGASTLAVIAWSLGTNAFGYATLFISHQLVAALFIGSFASAHFARGAPEKSAQRRLALSGLLASWAVVSEYPAAPLAALAMAHALWVAGPRRLWPFVVGAAIPAAVLGGFNALCFGSPFRLGYTQLSHHHFRGVIASGFMGLTTPRVEIIGRALFGEYRGLLPYSPFLVFLVPGAVVMLRDATKRPYAIGCLVGFVYGLVLVSAYPLWHGGAGMGPRYLVQALPFAVPLVAAGFSWAFTLPRAARAAASTLAFALVAVAVTVCTMTVSVMPELPDVRYPGAPARDVAAPDMERPLRDFVVPMFARGHLSVKGVGEGGSYTFSSIVPGHTRDAFNLGERMGLRGPASLVPLVLGWVVALVVALRALRRDAKNP
jgi:hypothetical protein